MTPLEMGLTLFITLLGGGILFWMIQVDTHFRRYSREAVAEREVQSARVSLLVDEVARLSDDCVALLLENRLIRPAGRSGSALTTP